MSAFLRLLAEEDKAKALAAICARIRRGDADLRYFDVLPESFNDLPGKPFAYWVSEEVREVFRVQPAFENMTRIARRGPSTCDDVRYLRCWWEVDTSRPHGLGVWLGFAKGGVFSRFYADVHLVVDWEPRRQTFLGFFVRPGREIERPESVDHFFRPGLTWSRRTTSGLSLRVLPTGCIFADKGPSVFVEDDDAEELLALLALANSRPFSILVELQLAAADAAARSYEVGVVQQTPVPSLPPLQRSELAARAYRALSLKRRLDTVNETSHAFVLPIALRHRKRNYHPLSIEGELAHIQSEIDAIAFDLYGFSAADGQAAMEPPDDGDPIIEAEEDEEDEEDDAGSEIPSPDALLSWCVGVVFSRFDLRLATGEREVSPEPGPFDPLPAKSFGMLPDGAEPFHAHAGVLVDDQGHPHDLVRLIEEVLARVDAPVSVDVRRWLQRDFFPLHLKQYSKSRRKAQIYWPLSTPSGSYALWLYYPSLTSQTLYTAVNDFIEGPNGTLGQVGRELTVLRTKGSARSRDDEKAFEARQTIELELIELRDTLLHIAPTYRPNHDDGVQITAAPLWLLFRHRPWQTLLKATWAKLERGDYDWAHLALAYWPDRVREKCKTDKSLAIAHGREDLYVESEPKPKRTRQKKK